MMREQKKKEEQKMYDSNNVHILVYVVFGIVGLFLGKLVAWMNMRFPEDKKIFSKEFFKANKEGLDKNYICMIVMAVLYLAILRKFGIGDTFMKNLELIKFAILMPMLVSSFMIDLKYRILPNRLNLTIFQVGLIFTFIYGINNINMAQDMLLGMLAGTVIFGAITLIGGLIAGKEAMGLGDVKFMGAIGLYFGLSTTAQISLLAFFIGAIVSVVVLLIRNLILKSDDQYMPFGPFLVVASIACIFLPANTVFIWFMTLCGAISDKILSLG